MRGGGGGRRAKHGQHVNTKYIAGSCCESVMVIGIKVQRFFCCCCCCCKTSIGPTLTSSGGSLKRKNKLIEDSSARRSESSITGSLKIPRLGGVKAQSLVMYGLCRFTSPEKECCSCGLLTAIQNHEVQVVGGGIKRMESNEAERTRLVHSMY